MTNNRSEWIQIFFNTESDCLQELIYSESPVSRKIGIIIETTKSVNSFFDTLLNNDLTINEVFLQLMLLNKKVILEAKHETLHIKNVTTHHRFIYNFISHVFDSTLKIMLDKHSIDNFKLVAKNLEQPPINRLWGLLEFMKNVIPFSVANKNGDSIDSDIDYLFSTLYCFLLHVKKHANIDDGVPNTNYKCIWDVSNITSSELKMLENFNITKPMLMKHNTLPTKDNH